MHESTKQAIRDWEFEVEAEMRKLIKDGVPPWEAASIARDTVSKRRQGNIKNG